MAEVQRQTQAGEMTRIFAQFIYLQQQQALLALGRHPNPPPGAPPGNITLAKAYIDQLEMIAVKTQGNLSAEEQQLINGALAQLRMIYVEVAGK